MSFPRFPDRIPAEQFYPLVYRAMLLARRLDERLLELFRKGTVRGTVTLGLGNEATAVGMALPLRPGRDVVSLLHRDLASHCVMGMSTRQVLCQYLANAASPTHGREGNVHHGDAARRRLPMISHLGNMLAPVVGGVWAARERGEDVLGLAVIGDGGANTGDFHESLNLAAVRGAPVLFVIENNSYAFSTPVSEQYRCARLSDRAAGYGVEGATVDGTDVRAVYDAVFAAMQKMSRTGMPYLLECMTLRMCGHAAYDKGEYIPEDERRSWPSRDPLPRCRAALAAEPGMSEAEIARIEAGVDAEIDEALASAIREPRPDPLHPAPLVFAPATVLRAPAFSRAGLTNQTAVTAALDYILASAPESFLIGLDIGPYGSAFKTCKGLHEKFGPRRVINMPLSESAMTGFALGASQTGSRPVVEFQFADFVTEAMTQLGLNCGTWYFRSGSPAPILVRLPCGGGVGLGAFHSGELEGVLTRFAGLKVLYPTTPQEMFEALVAGFHDPNPCVVLEHKLLYTRAKGDVAFDGDLARVWRPRRYREGGEATVVALGAMVETALAAVDKGRYAADVWNPFVLSPLDLGPIADSVARTGRLLVVQESGATAGLADRVVAQVCCRVHGALKSAPRIVSAPDTPVPFAQELEAAHRPDIERVSAALSGLCGERRE